MRKTERKPELSLEEKERLRQEKKDAKVTPRLAAQTCNPAEAGLQPRRGGRVTLRPPVRRQRWRRWWRKVRRSSRASGVASTCRT